MSGSLADEWGLVDAPGSNVASRIVGPDTPNGPVRVAIDGSGVRHLLVPTGPDPRVRTDLKSRGVILVGQRLSVGDHEIDFADLVCVDDGLWPVFVQLAEDICQRVASDPADAVAVVGRALDEWRGMLLPGTVPVSSESATGLFGELTLVHELARRDPTAALVVWAGPDGARHDFISAAGCLEVKTTTSVGWNVRVHGLDQVDPGPEAVLHLALVRLRPDPHGRTVPDLIDGIIGLGVARLALLERVRRVGYDPRTAEDWRRYRFALDSQMLWAVDDSFPGIRRSEQRESRIRAVDALSYRLDLAAVGEPLDARSSSAVLDDMVRS